MEKKVRALDPTLNALIDNLDHAAADHPDEKTQERHALSISGLSREIRFRLGPPWYHDPDSIDAIAEHFSTAVASMQGIRASQLVRTCATNTLQRMIAILEDKHGPAEKPWHSRMAALREREKQGPPTAA